MAKARAYKESAEVERPPAFQEYAAAALTTESVRLMSLGERGLLWSLRLYCWLNDSIPADPDQMARALGLRVDEVRENLTHRVREFFELAEDDQQRLVCPALVRQMARLMRIREAQAKAGPESARKRRSRGIAVHGERNGNRSGDRDGLEKSRTETKRAELGNGGHPKDPFVADMEAAEAAERGPANARPFSKIPR